MSAQESSRSAQGITNVRWWPALLILALASIVLLWLWGRDVPNRQNQVISTIVLLVVTDFLLLVWLLFFSRLALKFRLAAVTAGLLIFVGFAIAFELRDVSGDLVPMLAWRWSADDLMPPTSLEAVQGIARLASEADYPQYLGPHRNATLSGPRLARDWALHAPEELWRVKVGAGWSGFAVAGDFAVTHEQHSAREVVVAYDLESGAEHWSYGYAAKHEDPLGGVGPRATPAIADGQVFALGATGRLSCLDLASGELRWQRDILVDHNAVKPTYGVSNSPLILDRVVVVIAGGPNDHSLVAYDRQSGQVVWSGGSDSAGYSSPIVARLGSERQILAFTQRHLSGHDATDGKVLWRHPWPSGTESTSQPVVLPGGQIFLSSGYGVGSKLFQVGPDGEGQAWQATVLWESRGLKAKFTNVVYHDGYLYGLDDGILVCLDPRTGERRWKKGRYGHGQVILVHDVLLVQTEKGEVALVAAQPEQHHELGRFKALSGKSWNTPALTGEILLVRNSEMAAGYRLQTSTEKRLP